MSGFADAEDELDRFGRLDHANQAGQNSEHAAFGAGWNEAGRRRLGIEAAIAGAVFGREDAGLALEAEDRSVGVGLAGEHAGVVDQIAGLEVVGAVGDHVELADDLERVRAGQHGLELDDVDEGVEALEPLFGGVDLGAADAVGASE